MGDLPIAVSRCPEEKRKPIPQDPKQLGFGRHFTDHWFRCTFDPDREVWTDARLEPRGRLSLDPAAMVLHYGLEVFEGLKAYRGEDGVIYLFRWTKNAERMQSSAERLMMVAPPVDVFGLAVKSLVKLDRAWVPEADGCTLYLRPTLIAVDPFLGVRPARQFEFYVLASPVGAYYATGFRPTKIFVSEEDVRAAPGGVGAAKTGANYAGSLRAQSKAQKKGYNQVLYLDAVHRRFVEEVGTSNIFFKINGKVVTPPLGGTILPGVTRDSVIQILKHWKIPIAEEPIDINEVVAASKRGELEEVFGTGTAAVVSPIGVLSYKGNEIRVNDEQTGPLAQRLYEFVTKLQRGQIEDPFGWREIVD